MVKCKMCDFRRKEKTGKRFPMYRLYCDICGEKTSESFGVGGGAYPKEYAADVVERP